VPWVYRGALRAIAGPDQAVLRTKVALRGDGPTTIGDFTVAEGKTISFTLSYAPSHPAPPDPTDPLAALEVFSAPGEDCISLTPMRTQAGRLPNVAPSARRAQSIICTCDAGNRVMKRLLSHNSTSCISTHCAAVSIASTSSAQ
jgi:hypothetical protein